MEYGSAGVLTPGLLSGGGVGDAFSFESGSGTNSQPPNGAAIPKPRKFFKSRGAEDTGKNATGTTQHSSLNQNLYSDCSALHSENPGGEFPYSAAGASSVGYSSPTYTAPVSKAQGKRGRGRPRGSRSSTSPRRSAATAIKPSPARGAPRGRRRGKGSRAARGQPGSGRSKRKRAQWEESETEEEEEALSSEQDEQEEEAAVENQSYPVHSEEIGRDEPEDDDNEEEDEEEEEQEKSHAVKTDEEKEQPAMPPIKLRIIRRNDTTAFVSKVGMEATNVESESISIDPPVSTQRESMSADKDEVSTNGMPESQPATEMMPPIPEAMDVKESPAEQSPPEVNCVAVY